MSQRDEFQVQVNLALYLKKEHPGLLFRSDLGGIRLTIGQAKKVKRIQSGRSWPDIFIPEPRGAYLGLFGEIKTSEDEVFTKTGQLKKRQRIQEQAEMLAKLRARGYLAEFWFGFEDAKAKIEAYLSSKKLE